MIPVPSIGTTAGKTHLVSGRKLNALMEAIQARTQLDAQSAGAKGTRGTVPQGGAQIDAVLKQRFVNGRAYVLSAGFLRRLEAAVLARTPREAAAQDPAGYKPGTGGTGAKTPQATRSAEGIADILAMIRRLTPRDTGLTTPGGYRFREPPLPPKLLSMALEVQDRWGEAYFCYVGSGGSLPSATLYRHASTTSHYENGTITEVETSAGMRLFYPGSDPLECPAHDTSSDEDPEFDYGSLLYVDSTAYSDSATTDDVRLAAFDAVADDGSPYVARTASWYSDSPAPSMLDLDLAKWELVSTSDVKAWRPKYRWNNTGPARLRVEWDHGGSHHNIVVEAGVTTDWLDTTIPAMAGVYDAVSNVAFSLVW